MPLLKEENPVEITEWMNGDVSFIHTQNEGEYIQIDDSDLLVDLEEME